MKKITALLLIMLLALPLTALGEEAGALQAARIQAPVSLC